MLYTLLTFPPKFLESQLPFVLGDAGLLTCVPYISAFPGLPRPW